jgi:hypothetical protein
LALAGVNGSSIAGRTRTDNEASYFFGSIRIRGINRFFLDLKGFENIHVSNLSGYKNIKKNSEKMLKICRKNTTISVEG